LVKFDKDLNVYYIEPAFEKLNKINGLGNSK